MTFSIGETYMQIKIKITMPPKTVTLIPTSAAQSQISSFIIFLDVVNWAKLWLLYTCYQFFTENSFQQLFIIKMSGQIMLRTYRPYLVYHIRYMIYLAMVHDFDKIWKSYCRLIFSNQILHAYAVWCALKRGCIIFSIWHHLVVKLEGPIHGNILIVF